MRTEDLLFVGVKERVLALKRGTGEIVWATELNRTALVGNVFVNLFVDRSDVFAHTSGTLFCLDAQSGRVKWENPLKGCGYDIATLATSSGTSENLAAIVHKLPQDVEAASTASGSAGTS